MKRSASWCTVFLLVVGCGTVAEAPSAPDRQTLALRGFNAAIAFDCTTDTPWVPRPDAGSPSPSPTPTPLSPSPSVTPTPGKTCDEVTTYTQGGWGSRPRGNNPGQFLSTNWTAIAPSGTLVVGVGQTLTFTSAEAVTAFLPSGGTPLRLTTSRQDPVAPTEAGVFAGQVTALKLNVLASGVREPEGQWRLGELELASGPFSGLTVAAFLNLAERCLGGDTSVLECAQSISAMSDTAAAINEFASTGATPDGTFLGCPGR